MADKALGKPQEQRVGRKIGSASPLDATAPRAGVVRASLVSELLREVERKCYAPLTELLAGLERTCPPERLYWLLLGPPLTWTSTAELEAALRDWGPGDAYRAALLVARREKGIDLRTQLKKRDQALERLEGAIDDLLGLTQIGFPIITHELRPEALRQLLDAKRVVALFRKDKMFSVGPTSGSLVRTAKGTVNVSIFDTPAFRRARGRPRKSWKSGTEKGLQRAGVGRFEGRFLMGLVERRAKLSMGLPLSRREESEAVAADLMALVRGMRRSERKKPSA